MDLTSSAFQHYSAIPVKYTCQGENVSPPLTISDVPDNARGLVLIVDDPDAANGEFTHWLLFDVDPQIGHIAEGEAPETSVEGQNSFGQAGYLGPCPPPGQQHRYFFKLYAVDKPLELTADTEKGNLLRAMSEHVIDETELVGLYSRNEK